MALVVAQLAASTVTCSQGCSSASSTVSSSGGCGEDKSCRWLIFRTFCTTCDDESLSVCLAFSQFLCGSGTGERPSSESPECYSGRRVPQPFGARLPLNTDGTLRIRTEKQRWSRIQSGGRLQCVHLVHEKGGDGTRVGLIVQPEQFSSVRLGLRARPALVPLLSLGSAPRLGSIWENGPTDASWGTSMEAVFWLGLGEGTITLTAASRVIHLEVRSPWPPGGCGVSSPLQLFGLLYLLIIVISWKCKRLQFVIQLSPWLSIICSERHLPV